MKSGCHVVGTRIEGLRHECLFLLCFMEFLVGCLVAFSNYMFIELPPAHNICDQSAIKGVFHMLHVDI